LLGISSVVLDVTRERQRTASIVTETYAKLENRVEERTRKLKRSESQFREFLESVPDGVVVCDDTGEIVLVNAVTERLFGYRREELVGLAVEILIPEITRDLSVNNRVGYQTEIVPPVMAPRRELSAKRKDGSEFPVEVSLNPTAIGDRTLVMALTRDVTEARALLESRLSLATMVDSSTDAIITAKLDGTIQRWNKGAERMYGYSAQEAIGMPLERLAPPEFLSEQRPVLEAIAGGVPAQLPDTVRVRKNG
jgi:PAS domain S-box-containing protein